MIIKPINSNGITRNIKKESRKFNSSSNHLQPVLRLMPQSKKSPYRKNTMVDNAATQKIKPISKVLMIKL